MLRRPVPLTETREQRGRKGLSFNDLFEDMLPVTQLPFTGFHFLKDQPPITVLS
jgi:hypothetical protein